MSKNNPVLGTSAAAADELDPEPPVSASSKSEVKNCLLSSQASPGGVIKSQTAARRSTNASLATSLSKLTSNMKRERFLLPPDAILKYTCIVFFALFTAYDASHVLFDSLAAAFVWLKPRNRSAVENWPHELLAVIRHFYVSAGSFPGYALL